MAQPTSNPKIEELRIRLKSDARSRLFYPLAEELRKISRFEEAEQVLRSGLEHHPTYLSAWVGLGRVLRDEKKNDGAVEALKKALQLDPGNVVAARLLADAYLDLGDKVEAIKKYKLVDALLPGDEELQAKIEQLDRDLNPLVPAGEETPFAEAAAQPSEETPLAPPKLSFDETRPARPEPFAVAGGLLESEHQPTIETPFADAEHAAAEKREAEIATGDAEPMAVAHERSPFEESGGFTAAAVTVEKPPGVHIESAPLDAEDPSPWEEEVPASAEPEPADVFAPAEPIPSSAPDELTNTLTMAELYVKQGLVPEARRIYENILQRDAGNDDVRRRLDALSSPVPPPGRPDPKVKRLENWLAKVGKKEQGRV